MGSVKEWIGDSAASLGSNLEFFCTQLLEGVSERVRVRAQFLPMHDSLLTHIALKIIIAVLVGLLGVHFMGYCFCRERCICNRHSRCGGPQAREGSVSPRNACDGGSRIVAIGAANASWVMTKIRMKNPRYISRGVGSERVCWLPS